MMSITNFIPAVLKLLFVSATFVILPTAAIADAIDGDWCAKMGRHLNIDGPKIKTPGGNKITGGYERHGFSYVVPSGEVHGSETIHMQMHSEDLILMTLPDGSIEKWSRCDVVS
jgi:hypothetical protein